MRYGAWSASADRVEFRFPGRLGVIIVPVLFIFDADQVEQGSGGVSGHAGFVAGRYRSGACSDGWTDARRCAAGTFTDYVPACTCGWRGRPEPVGEVGWVRCRRAWLTEHLRPLSVPEVTTLPTPRRPVEPSWL